MKIPYTNYNIKLFNNADKKQPERVKVSKKIIAQQLYRSRQDVSNWRDALNQAESVHNPDRIELYRIYQDVMLDSHLSSVWNTRVNNILSEDFNILDKNGDKDEKTTELFENKWFQDFQTYALESKLYGHSLIQFGDIKNDIPSLELVNRNYVVPEFKIIKSYLHQPATKDSGLNYSESPYKEWLIEIGGGSSCFGLLNILTPIVLWKKNAFGAWAEYLDMFGMPIRLGKTDIRDPERRSQMEHMMEEMGKASYGVFDNDDDIQLVQSGSSSGNPIYDNLIERVNSEISKVILGQTMTSDNGSSRSQAEVHEGVMNDYRSADKRFSSNEVNNKLMPWMQRNRLIPEGSKFEYVNKEKLSTAEKVEYISKLAPHFNISPEFVEKYTGVEVEEKEDMESKPTSVMRDVENLYKDLLD